MFITHTGRGLRLRLSVLDLESLLCFTFHGIGSFSYLHSPCECSSKESPNTPNRNHLKTQSKEITHLVACKGVCTSAISLLGDRELDTLALGEGDPGLL